MRERGVEYVEVRLLDLNPFIPIGIDAQSLRLLDVFLLHCLVADSPVDTPQELEELKENQHLAAARGREPGLQLLRQGRLVSLRDWGNELVEALRPIADRLDAVHGGADYRAAVEGAVLGLAKPEQLPSARVLQSMAADHENSFVAFARV